MLKSEFSTFHHVVGGTNPKNEKVQFKAALRRYLKTRPFHSLDEFYISKDDP